MRLQLKDKRLFLIVLSVFSLWLVLSSVANSLNTSPVSCGSFDPQASSGRITGIIESLSVASENTLSKDPAVMQIRCLHEIEDHSPEFTTIPISIETSEGKQILRNFGVGDQVVLTYLRRNDNQENAQPGEDLRPGSANVLENLVVKIIQVDGSTRLSVLLLVSLACFAICLALLRENVKQLVVGKDGRVSNSKTQIALWFFVLIVSYISLNVLRIWQGGLGFVGGISIPEHLQVISGISALTFVGAKGITVSKVSANPDYAKLKRLEHLNNKEKKRNMDQKARFENLFQDDEGNTDLGDFQMIVITALFIVVYSLELFNFLGEIKLHSTVSLPDVDGTLLTTFGFGQLAYLGKKYFADGAKPAV